MPAPFDEPAVCPVLIGRDEPLRALLEAAALAVGGRPRTILVTGEAGVGKSRLSAELHTRLAADGWLRLQGHCFERTRSTPYGALADLLRAELRGQSPADQVARLGSFAPEVALLLPELAPWLPPIELPAWLTAEQHKRQLFHALDQLFADLGAGRPMLVVVEDVHWADDGTLDFLQFFARSLAERPILLLLTFRGDEVSRPLEQLLVDLDRERLARELPLRGLDSGQVHAMLRATLRLDRALPTELLEQVHALTEGNPFFVEELVGSLIASGDIFRAAGAWSRRATSEIRDPRTVQDAVQRRTEHLGEAARTVLEVAAVAGQQFAFDLLQAVTESDEQTLLRQLKELIGAQLLVEETADRYAFRHALTRQAVYGRLLARERRLLHRQVAEAMQRLYADVPEAHLAELALQLHAAGLWAQALATSRRAGERALAVYAPGAAVEHFSRALDAAEQLALAPPPALCQARGRAFEAVGDFERARTDFEQALSGARAAATPLEEWEALVALGLLWAGRDYAQASAWFRQALAVATAVGEPALRAHSLNRVGNALVNVGQPEDGLAGHREALAIFEALDDQPGIDETADLLGMGLAFQGDPVAAGEQFARASAGFRARDDRLALASALTSGATFHAPLYAETSASPLWSLAAFRREAAEVERAARQTAALAPQAYAGFALGQAYASYGELGEALAYARSGLVLAEQIGHQQWATGARFALGATYLVCLAAERALAVLEEAAALARGVGSAWWLENTSVALAQAYLQLGDSRRAGRVLDNDFEPDGAGAPRTNPQRRATWIRGELALAQGNPLAALRAAEALISSTPGGARGQAIPSLYLLKANALAALGRPQEAVSVLDQALRGAQAREARPVEWQVHRALGRVHQAAGRKAEALQAFAAARVVVESMAATLSDADADLRQHLLQTALGSLPAAARVAPHPPAPRPGGLTPRELEVAALVGRGHSNREIADVLVLGERTIETHISSILSKLGVRSRREIALWAASRHVAEADRPVTPARPAPSARPAPLA